MLPTKVPWLTWVGGGSHVLLVEDPMTGTETIPLRHYERNPRYMSFREMDESSVETLTRHPIWIWSWRIVVLVAAFMLEVAAIIAATRLPGIYRLIAAGIALSTPFIAVLAWDYLNAMRFVNVFHVRRSGITMRKGGFRVELPEDLSGEDISGVKYIEYWWSQILRLNIGKLIIQSGGGSRKETIPYVGNCHDAYRLVDMVNKRGGTFGLVGPLTLLVRAAWEDGAIPDGAIDEILGPVTGQWRAEQHRPNTNGSL